MKRTSVFSRFLRHTRGATAVEFGLIAVPFLGLLAMIFNTGLACLMERNLDTAVQNAVRQVRTGAVQASGIQSASDFVSNYVCSSTAAMMGSFIDCSKLIVDVRTASAFTGNDMSNAFYKTQSANLFCLGAPSSITVVRVAYPMPWFIPVVTGGPTGISASQAGLVNDVPGSVGKWMLLLTSAAIVRTEPYPAGQYTKKVGCP